MPHIHTEPDQHDITVSAWIVRKEADGWKCLVHYHKKMDVLMQVGGHIELDETPWQAVAHEISEESGYQLNELSVLQFMGNRVADSANIVHPIPFTANTHSVGNEHFHSDFCYGFVAKDTPRGAIKENESMDLRWLTVDELKSGVLTGEVIGNVAATYEHLLRSIDILIEITADSFSLQKPQKSEATYKRGLPGEVKKAAL